MDTSRPDVTHPPTTFRIATLSGHPVGNKKLTIDLAESAAIQKELAQVEPEIQMKLVELQRAGYFVQ